MIRMHATLMGMTAAAASLALVAGGCQQDNKPPYGSQMRSSVSDEGSAVSTPTTPPPTVVPAGATPLSTGTYNQIQFTVPDQSGLIYVFDQDTNKVVGMTNSVQANAGKSMTMADLKNTAQGLNMTDHYRIYFAPSHATTTPIGGSGM